jgi:hypothetical protein
MPTWDDGYECGTKGAPDTEDHMDEYLTEAVVAEEHQVLTVDGRAAAPAAIPIRRAAVPVVASDRVVTRSWTHFSVSQVIHGLCGVVLLMLGALAIAQGGFDGTASEQTSEVLGIDMTTVLGLVVVAAGLLLVIAALTPSGRPFGGFVGVLIAVGGVVVAFGSDELLADLHTERSLGWLAIVLGVISVAAAFLPERSSLRQQAVLVG